MEVSEELRQSTFDEFGPFVIKKKVTFDTLAPHVQQLIRDTNRSQQPREMLIDSCSAENMFVTSDLLAFYLEKGITVTQVRSWFEYKPSSAAKPFIDKVTAFRQKADQDEMTKQLASLYKLTGNSTYVCPYLYLRTGTLAHKIHIRANFWNGKNRSVTCSSLMQRRRHNSSVVGNLWIWRKSALTFLSR